MRPLIVAAMLCLLAGCGVGAASRHPLGARSAGTPGPCYGHECEQEDRSGGPNTCFGPLACGSATGSVAPPGWGEQGPPPTLRSVPAPASTATMYDSITIGAIPARPFADAGYTGGLWATLGDLRRTWPRAHTVSVAVSAGEHAACADVEPGDLIPAQAPGWVRADERAGYRKPCLYSDWWEWTHELGPALARAGILRSQVYEWDADYTGRPHLDAGFEATQYNPRCLGRDLDCSLVLRSFLAAADPPLRPPPAPPAPCGSTCRQERLREIDILLGAHSRHNEHGHNCQDPPYRHAYPSARWDHACLVWARQVRALR
jgi:hypothetical protein